MRLEPDTLILSKRNLLSLLHKLEMEGSEKTLGVWDGTKWFYVKSESDEEHYKDRIPAGVMHPETEQFLSEH